MRKLILLIFTLLLGINASWAHVTSTSGIKANATRSQRHLVVRGL